MTRRGRAGWVALAILLATCAGCAESKRTPEDIYRDIAMLKPPKDGDFTAKMQHNSKKAELIGEFYRAVPDYPYIAELMAERWTAMAEIQSPEKVLVEVDEVIGKTNAEDPISPLGLAARYFRASLLGLVNPEDPGPAMKAIDEYLAKAPPEQKPRAAELLLKLAGETKADPTRIVLLERVVKEFPESPNAENLKVEIKRLKGVGQPLDFEFVDVLSGKTMTPADFKGKVVVLDFWATWCGPCIESLPEMKKLYNDNKDKGVAFIGVSLDLPEAQGGLDKLKAFIAKNEMPWPQYHEKGKVPAQQFALDWGIAKIPAIFVLDKDGKLVSLDARGQLGEIVSRLLDDKKS